MFMLVSHRNLISVFDMTTQQDSDAASQSTSAKGGWIKTLAFESEGVVFKDHIRQMFIKKREKAERMIIEQQKRDKFLQDPGREGW